MTENNIKGNVSGENDEENLKDHVERDTNSPNRDLVKDMLEQINVHKYDLSEDKKISIKKLKDSPPLEVDNEDEIAKGLLYDLKDMIKTELISKEKTRKILTIFLILAFSIIGILTSTLVFFSNYYDTRIVLAVISGFFVNTISLVLVILKYMFSPSKDIYDYTLGIFRRKNGE